MKLGELIQMLIELEADMSMEVVIGYNNTIGSGTVDSVDVFCGKLLLTCEQDAVIDNQPPASGGEDQ